MVTMVLSYLSMATVFWIRDLVSLEQDLDLVGVAGGQDELLSMQDCGDWDTIEHQVALILDTHGVQSLPLLILASRIIQQDKNYGKYYTIWQDDFANIC